MHYNMKLLHRAKSFDAISSRPRNNLKESLIKDLLECIEVKDMELEDAELLDKMADDLSGPAPIDSMDREPASPEFE